MVLVARFHNNHYGSAICVGCENLPSISVMFTEKDLSGIYLKGKK